MLKLHGSNYGTRRGRTPYTATYIDDITGEILKIKLDAARDRAFLTRQQMSEGYVIEFRDGFMDSVLWCHGDYPTQSLRDASPGVIQTVKNLQFDLWTSGPLPELFLLEDEHTKGTCMPQLYRQLCEAWDYHKTSKRGYWPMMENVKPAA